MYNQIQLTAFECICEKCGHAWKSVKESLPTHCPSRTCSNPTKWNNPALSKARKIETKQTAKDSGLRYELTDDFGA